MCGIISLFAFKPIPYKMAVDVNNFLTQAAYVGSLRGRDSTGMMWLPRDTKGSPAVIKRAVDGSMFTDMYNAKEALRDSERYSFSVIHNRKATHGGISDNTAHPFQVEHITLVHNGTLNNHRSLPRGTESSVDSKAVACALNTVEPDKAVDILEQLQGAYVLIWHDVRDNSINIAKNDKRPYTLAYIKDEDMLFGASERNMLEWLMERNSLPAEQFFSPKNHIHYKWLIDENSVRNWYVTEYEPSFSYGYPQLPAITPNDSQMRNARFKELEKIGFKRDQRIVFEWYDYDLYPQSTAMGILKGIDDTFSLDVIAYNVSKDLTDKHEKLSGTITYVKDTSSFPAWMTVVVTDVQPVKEEGTNEKKLISEVEEMLRDEHEKENFVAGPGGVLIPRSEWDELTKRGCGGCTCNLEDPNAVTWTFMEEPLCPDCNEEINFYDQVGHC